MRAQQKITTALFLLASLSACSKKTPDTVADTAAVAAPPQVTAPPSTVPSIPTDTLQHHSRIKGAIVGAAVGAAVAGKRGVLVGASAGAALQTARNKNDIKKK
ncbi:MAG TPA: hypothetical protein VM099_08830 [Gemmatimonadaceae bacterium]|nr:hypothetical protein [Gemmatimonadaceae bacterium]